MQVTDAMAYMSDMAKKEGAEAFDILAGVSASDGINLFQKKVQSVELSSSQGIGIRLFHNNCPGYAYTERFTKEAILQSVKDALSHTHLTGELDVDLSQPLAKEDKLSLYNPEIESITTDQMTEWSIELEDAVLSSSSEIVNIPYLGFSRSSGETHFLNSLGQSFLSKGNSYYFGAGAVAQRGEANKLGVYTRGGRDLAEINIANMAQKVGERSTELLGASAIASGEYTILFSNRISAQLLSMFSSPFFAENIHKGQSSLEGKLGQSIACKDFSLINDPTLVNFSGSTIFDGEGVVAQKTNIVVDGVLDHYLYNLEAAKKDKVASNGSASRGYSGKVGTGFSNLIVPLGSVDATALKSSGKVLEIIKLEGGSGCSAVSGEISIGAQGFLLNNGIVEQVVDGITVSGNFYDLLQNIQGISNEWSDTFSPVKVPDLLVSGFKVSG